MGDTIENWRATIGQWSGGRSRKCVILQNNIAKTSNHIAYIPIRYLVLVSLLVIGCVELNPGPNNENSASTQSAGAPPKFNKRRGTAGLHGALYEVKTAAFLFARALNRTEEFQLASNVDGAGDLDDLVFRYRLRESDFWKTCFVQLKHKKSGGYIRVSDFTKLSGDFSLLKYFKSYCEIKNNATTHPTLIECGQFVEFEFVIYTNGMLEINSPLQGGDSDPISILSSGKDCGTYITFDEKRSTDEDCKTSNNDIFKFFAQLSNYHEFIKQLNSLLNCGTSVDEDIDLKIKTFQSNVSNKSILGKLNSLRKNPNKDNVTGMIEELSKCDFNLYEEFLSKVKIFHGQSDIDLFKELTEKELQEACKATPLVVSFIYGKLEEAFSNWWEREGYVECLNQNSDLWRTVQKYITTEIKGNSEPVIQEIDGCSVRFNQQNVQKLSDAIEQNTILNIITNSSIRILQRVKTYQALNNLGYRNLLFIALKSLEIKSKEIRNFWPCKWCDVLVVDCESDGNVAQTVLKILQNSADCEDGSDVSEDKMTKYLVQHLQKYQQTLVLISTQKNTTGFQEKIPNISYFEDNCDISDFDEKYQKEILERPVNFQGTNVPLSTLVGTDPPESIKKLLDSSVISILLSKKHELSVGRHLADHCQYYVPRVLQHQIHLRKDILKLTDKGIRFAVSGLQADELKKYLPAAKEVCELVYNEGERIPTLRIVNNFSKTGLSDECGTTKAQQKKKSRLLVHNNFGNKNTGIEISDRTKNNSYRNFAKYSMNDLRPEVENMKTYNEAGLNTKPEDARYIILGNKNQETEFEDLKELCENVHWIHVENDSFLWKGTNSRIGTIRSYIDNTKYEKYDMKSILEHKDRTMLLVSEPGMGKSTFLSHMAHEIKKWKPSVWVLRINLNEHTKNLKEFEYEQDSAENCVKLVWNAAHSAEQDGLKVTEEIFLNALGQAGKFVIILDGFDEISPDYSHKVEMLIRAIREQTASKIWISSRFVYRDLLEDIVKTFGFTLQPFSKESQIQFLENYWSENNKIFNQENLKIFAEKVLNLFSDNCGDKDGEFTSIPLQTMMLGKAFGIEAEEYSHIREFNLPENFNLLCLFKMFTESKFEVYRTIKNKMGTSKQEVENGKKDYEEKHMISAFLYLLSPKELNEIRGAIPTRVVENTKRFLREGKAQTFGIIPHTTDGNPHFINRCFAEYFAAKWFAENFKQCEEFISNFVFKPMNKVTRIIFDRILAEGFKIHDSILNNDIHALKKFLKEKSIINNLDNGGRTALHLAASYNSPYIKELLAFPDIDVNIKDAVLKWTPLTYAERTKSWMAMDILLQNGANHGDIE